MSHRAITWLFAAFLAVTATAAAAAPDGARLFARHCAACHGEQGSGGIGVPLALPSFQRTISDDYVRQTIRRGRPGRIMPAFSQLRADEVEALVRYVRSWNPGPVAHYAATSVRGDPVRGRALFAAHCAACHGAHGEGGKGTGVTFSRPRDLPIMAPALNNPGFLAAASDAMIKATLIHGREGTPMVSFLKKGLSERDIDDVVSYVRSFEKAPAPAGVLSLQGEPPVIVRESPYDLKTTIERTKAAIQRNDFFFGRMQPLDYGLVPEERSDPHQVVLYFCDIQMLNQALAVDPRVGMFLPCRITVVERDGRVSLMSVNPKVMSPLFNNAELNNLCQRMGANYARIMEEAVR